MCVVWWEVSSSRSKAHQSDLGEKSGVWIMHVRDGLCASATDYARPREITHVYKAPRTCTTPLSRNTPESSAGFANHLGSGARRTVAHVTAVPDLTKTLDDLANQLQTMADRAVPTANRIAKVIKAGGFLGLLGGIAGAAAISLPGFGFADSWPFFVLLVSIALGCATVVFRWSKVLRTWTGDIKTAVNKLHDIPTPGSLVAELRQTTSSLMPIDTHHGKPGELAKAVATTSGRANVIALVRVGTKLRKRIGSLPGAALHAKDLFVQLTGPFRPPFLVIRLAMLFGGLAMVFFGPILAIVAAIVN